MSDGSGGGSSNPFGGSAPAVPRMASRNNPFGDDDDDEDNDSGDDDPLSRFGKKKAPPPPPPPAASASASASASNPSASLTSSGTGMGGGAGNNNPFDSPAATSAKKRNPFDDSPAGGGSARKSFSSGTSKKNVNPFGEDGNDRSGNVGAGNTANNQRQQMQSSASVRMSFKKSGPTGGSNPFGEDGSDSGKAGSSVRPPRPAGAAAGFGEDTKPTSVKPARGLESMGSSIRRLTPDGANHTTPSSAGGSAPAARPPVAPRSNPFGDDPPAAPVPKPLLSNPQNSGNNTNLSGINPGSNPFDGDGGSGAAAKRGWMFGAGGRGGDTDSTRPMLSAMDEDSTVEPKMFQPKNAVSSNAAGLASWLRMNRREDERNDDDRDHMGGGAGGAGRDRKKKPKKKKCRAVVTPWPFDYYHEEQERMYEELASRAASDHRTHDGGYHSGSDDEKKDDLLGTGMGAVASKYYERPEELPSIKEAVNDLPLVDFEKKAEERAINIVSTWLFDAGLIDELLVNGAMSASVAHQPSRMASNASVDGSVKTSEGVEVGAHGFPLVGAEGAELKMDKETNKLRGAIQRDLAIINARLNDGVAASGLEVQELVNAVGATKEDIGRLRELTTYISDGQISDRNEFLLAQYPYLRKAINARRNINRCFRELEFFSQIPSTCERLRDELHGGEWTAEEWNTIRNVSMEHVELEMLLIEAENSMKGADQFNDAMVDRFLETHVGNVWELGEEIRMRILSGIGSAFDLAVNNPAGIVALVEAVEVYERAAETFEKKRQNSNTESGNLRFTNMRAAALEQLYQDFELRGVEMFKEVHEGVSSCCHLQFEMSQ